MPAHPPSSDSTWLAWFDGCAHPNPGRTGIGGTLLAPNGGLTEISQTAGYGDSSRAEYLALIAILEIALSKGVRRLQVHGDSLVVIDDVQARHGKTAVVLTQLREQAQSLAARFDTIDYRWIPRHRNTAADALSQRAVRNTSCLAAPDINE